MIKLLIITSLVVLTGVTCGVSFSTAHAMESTCFISHVEVGDTTSDHNTDGIQRYWVYRVCYDNSERGYAIYGNYDTIMEINEAANENWYTTVTKPPFVPRDPPRWFDGP